MVFGGAWQSTARRGLAMLGEAGPGTVGRGEANTQHPVGGAEVCVARLGGAWQGKARNGVARQTHSIPWGAEVCGEARHGKARRGLARQGMANTQHPVGVLKFAEKTKTKEKRWKMQ
jgi:hypothetical protein